MPFSMYHMKMMKIRMNPGKLNDEMGGGRRKEDDQ
jgi:hypothetical protein